MKHLIITEKPSVSEIIAHSVGALEKKRSGREHYYEGLNYIVAHACGHLYGIGLTKLSTLEANAAESSGAAQQRREQQEKLKQERIKKFNEDRANRGDSSEG